MTQDEWQNSLSDAAETNHHETAGELEMHRILGHDFTQLTNNQVWNVEPRLRNSSLGDGAQFTDFCRRVDRNENRRR
jgi:hypothetical protein